MYPTAGMLFCFQLSMLNKFVSVVVVQGFGDNVTTEPAYDRRDQNHPELTNSTPGDTWGEHLAATRCKRLARFDMWNLSPDPFFRQARAPLRRKSSTSRYRTASLLAAIIRLEIDNNNARVCKLPQDCSCNCQRWSGYAHDPTHITVILYTAAEIMSV